MTPFERKRFAAGLTQEALAKKLKVSQSAVKKWEKGMATPSPKLFPRLARIFGMTAEELTYLFEPATPEPSVA